MRGSRTSKKPTLSPSKISTFLACPFKYNWTYRDSRGRWYLKSKSYYSFGSTLHRVLEKFYDTNESGVTTLPEVLEAYEENWISAGYESAEEMAESFAQGKELLTRHVEDALKTPIDGQTIFLEKQFRLDMGEFILIGRVDRVDRRADGTIEIIDYKSSRKGVDAESIKADIAMGSYQLMLTAIADGNPVKATIIALSTGETASFSFTNQERQEFEFSLRELGNHILNKNWDEKRPEAKPLCLRCDFVKLCSENREYREEFQAIFNASVEDSEFEATP